MFRIASLIFIMVMVACAPVDPKPEETDPSKPEPITESKRPPQPKEPFQCEIPGELESIGQIEPVHIRPEAGFGRYQRVYFEPLYIEYRQRPASGGPGSRAGDFELSPADERQLNQVFKEALIQDWRNRFGWNAAEDRGENVLAVEAWITDLRFKAPLREQPQTSTVLNRDNAEFLLTVQLSDSDSGEVLLYSCQQRMRASNTAAADGLEPFSKASLWQSLERAFTRWASRIGSHIMTAN